MEAGAYLGEPAVRGLIGHPQLQTDRSSDTHLCQSGGKCSDVFDLSCSRHALGTHSSYTTVVS